MRESMPELLSESSLRWSANVVFHLLHRPELWLTALDQGHRMARSGWWRRPPFLPVPAPHYLAFRLQTMYGDRAANADPADLLAWLAWCRHWRHSGLDG